MPRFYFDTDDGTVRLEDVYGIELPNAEAARTVAVTTLPAMAHDADPTPDQQKFVVHVSDEAHRSVLDANLNIDVKWA